MHSSRKGCGMAREADGLRSYLEQRRQHAIDACSACGTCFRQCPVLEHLDFGDLKPGDVQAQIRAFLDGGPATDDVFRRAFSCMACYGCCEGVCCLLYTSDAADEEDRVDLGGR